MRRFVVVGIFAAVMSMSGCVVAQRVDSALDCNGICERYAGCYDKSYDVSACASRCRAAASDKPDYRRTADMCNACLTDRSCMSAFACTSECISVVP